MVMDSIATHAAAIARPIFIERILGFLPRVTGDARAFSPFRERVSRLGICRYAEDYPALRAKHQNAAARGLIVCRFSGKERNAATAGPAGSGGEDGLDGGDDLVGLRLGPGAEPGDDLALRVDEELLEVPLDVAGRAVGVRQLGQLGVD